MNDLSFVLPNEDFQTSINIDFDLEDERKVRSLVVTNTVSRYLEELLRDVIAPSQQRAKLLVGAYGKGKSHIILAALHAMWKKQSKACSVVAEAMNYKNLEFAQTFEQFAEDGARLLPVIVPGNSTDLQRSLLYALRNALKIAGLGTLMPSTNYDAAAGVINRWKEYYPETFKTFEKATGENGDDIIRRLGKMDSDAYSAFVQAYPDLTAGSKFDELDGANVLSVYGDVLSKLKDEGYAGIYVVYDEFSKYLEASIAETTSGDIRFLQDFAETCNRSGQDTQLHLLLVSHKSLENYIDTKLSTEKTDGWRGVSGRFKEVVMTNDFNQYYELIERAIVKDEKAFKKWLTKETRTRLNEVYERYKDLFVGIEDTRIYEGCYPLHPLSTYLLPRMSERAAQNERTLFTFLCGNEDAALNSVLKKEELFYVMPDHIYDYFEPQLRKEFYTSPLHKIFELTRSSLSRVDSGSLEARIIKAIALIDVVAQYDRVAPTRSVIVELFKDDGFTDKEVSDAIENLIEVQSIVYLKRSNSYLKLKESSGVSIDVEIAERAERLKIEHSPVDILNTLLQGKSLYPSKYNDEHRIVRYFKCKFATPSMLNDIKAAVDADGEVIAYLPETADDRDKGEELAKRVTENIGSLVIAIPKKFTRIDDVLYKLKAAKQLKNEAENDTVLNEEYEIVVEDLSEIADEFIGLYFQPELHGATYIENGKRRNKVKRKHHLSEILSDICSRTFPYTPYITSEALNKNELTGTAFSSRSRILKAICTSKEKGVFDFEGNGQETSMMRSALERTGLIGNSPNEEMKRVIKLIDQFLSEADGDSFKTIYDKLMGREEGIGMRSGPIPIYLAWVMKDCADELKITHNGEEKAFTNTLLDDVSKCPEDYTVTRVNWTPEMASFTKRLAKIFDSEDGNETRNEVAAAIRHWYIGLPQVARNTNFDRTSPDNNAEMSRTRKKLFKVLRQIDLDADELLFERLPKVFDCLGLTEDLAEQIAAEKNSCDSYLNGVKDALIQKVVQIYEPGAPTAATLGSVLHGWIEDNPVIDTLVFNGVENQLVKAITQANGDDRVTIGRLAKAATALRIDDWNDDRFDDFIAVLETVKKKVENGQETENDPYGKHGITIAFTDKQGEPHSKTFAPSECGKRAQLLHRQITAALAEMGGSLQPEEKRQVVFDVLMELC